MSEFFAVLEEEPLTARQRAALLTMQLGLISQFQRHLSVVVETLTPAEPNIRKVS